MGSCSKPRAQIKRRLSDRWRPSRTAAHPSASTARCCSPPSRTRRTALLRPDRSCAGVPGPGVLGPGVPSRGVPSPGARPFARRPAAWCSPSGGRDAGSPCTASKRSGSRAGARPRRAPMPPLRPAGLRLQLSTCPGGASVGARRHREIQGVPRALWSRYCSNCKDREADRVLEAEIPRKEAGGLTAPLGF